MSDSMAFPELKHRGWRNPLYAEVATDSGAAKTILIGCSDPVVSASSWTIANRKKISAGHKSNRHTIFKAAAGSKKHESGNAAPFKQGRAEMEITEEVVKPATSSEECGKEVMRLLTEADRSSSKITEEMVENATDSLDKTLMRLVVSGDGDNDVGRAIDSARLLANAPKKPFEQRHEARCPHLQLCNLTMYQARS